MFFIIDSREKYVFAVWISSLDMKIPKNAAVIPRFNKPHEYVFIYK